MNTNKNENVEYANFFSKLLLSDSYKYQFTIPPTVPTRKARFLSYCERKFMNVDISSIEIDRPIFIVSLPRTGSSMLQNIISKQGKVGYFSHLMNVYYPNFVAMDRIREKLNLDLKGERFIGDSVMLDTTGPCDPIPIWNKWIKKDPFTPKFLDLKLADLSENQIDEIRSSIKKALWCSRGKNNRFMIKSPGIIPYLPLVAELFPDAKFVHLVRDPRQCANSLLKLTNKSINQINMIAEEKKGYEYSGKTPVSYPHLPRLAEYIEKFGVDDIRTAANVWRDGMNFVDNLKGDLGSFYEVRYEDILSNPKDELYKILDFCELDIPSLRNETFWKELSSVGTVFHKNAYSDFDVIEDICADTMQRYGYQKSANSQGNNNVTRTEGSTSPSLEVV